MGYMASGIFGGSKLYTYVSTVGYNIGVRVRPKQGGRNIDWLIGEDQVIPCSDTFQRWTNENVTDIVSCEIFEGYEPFTNKCHKLCEMELKLDEMYQPRDIKLTLMISLADTGHVIMKGWHADKPDIVASCDFCVADFEDKGIELLQKQMNEFKKKAKRAEEIAMLKGDCMVLKSQIRKANDKLSNPEEIIIATFDKTDLEEWYVHRDQLKRIKKN